MQTSRAVHYLVYFLAGVGIGAAGLERGLVSTGGKLAARWPLWLAGAAAAFGLAAQACLAFGLAAALSWLTASGLRRLARAASRAPSAAAPIAPRSHAADRPAA